MFSGPSAGVFGWPYWSVSSKTPFFDNWRRPGALRRDEGFAVDGEAIVLVTLSEPVLLPGNAKGSPFVFAELGVLGEEAGLFERLGDLPPIGVSPFFGFSFFQTAPWSSRGAEAMVRSSCSLGMSPAPI